MSPGIDEPSAAPPTPQLTTRAAWWSRADELASVIGSGCSAARANPAWRFGDAVLELATTIPSVLIDFDALYSECRVEAAHGITRVLATALPTTEDGVICVNFESTATLDLLSIVLTVIEPRLGERCVVSAPEDGWRTVTALDLPGSPVVATDGRCLLAHVPSLPPFFLRGCLLASALSIQKDVLFLHAASAVVGSRGLLIGGRSGAGKTTLALTLASRGHGLLGDDMAAIRTTNSNLLPLRRTIHIRNGPRATAVTEALRTANVTSRHLPGSSLRLCAEPRNLFPDAPAEAEALAAVFLLRRFRREPGLEPFVPSREMIPALSVMTLRTAWTNAPAIRLFKYFMLINVLSRARCFHLDVGRPEETAALVEKTLESL